MPRDSEASLTRWTCSPQHPCNRFYHCDRCASRRQARWADLAERIEAAFGTLTLAVLTPATNDQHALDKLKRAAIRNLCSPALLWSVEVGATEGRLHLNLLGPNLDFDRMKHALIDAAPVRTTARNAAAYIHKRAGFPPPSQYAGRIAGTAGTVMEYLAQAKTLPVAQAGALLKILETARFNREPLQLPQAQTRQDLRSIAQAFIAQLDKIERAAHSNMLKKGTVAELQSARH